MSSWFSDGKSVPRAALEKILRYMKRTNQPTYLGYISMEVGYGLGQTSALLDVLESEGLVRPATDEEKSSLSIEKTHCLYVLTERKS